MSGAAIGKSIVLDVSRSMTTLQERTAPSAQVQPGMLYREFEGVLGGLFRVWIDVFASRRWGWVLNYFVTVSGSDTIHQMMRMASRTMGAARCLPGRTANERPVSYLNSWP